jgi:hypothetical protein
MLNLLKNQYITQNNVESITHGVGFSVMKLRNFINKKQLQNLNYTFGNQN